MDDILQCKEVVKYFADTKKNERAFKIVQSNWPLIEEAVKILKLFFFTTKQLQRIDFTLSDFFGHLLALKENIKIFMESNSSISNLANCLETELNTRLPMLNTNPLMLCAVFLDRRYSTELNNDERALAIRTLVKLWEDFRSEHGNNNSNTEKDNAEQFRFEHPSWNHISSQKVLI